MSLTREEVQHIANLARLALTDEELERYREQISSILAHFTQLEALDTEAIPPTSSVLSAKGTLRADHPRPSLTPEELLHNAPESEQQLFRVPPVFD